MTEDEIHDFVEDQMSRVYNGMDEFNAAQEAIAAKWLEDRLAVQTAMYDKGYDEGTAYGRTVGNG